MRRTCFLFVACLLVLQAGLPDLKRINAQDGQPGNAKEKNVIRIATFNVALNRRKEGALLTELQSGDSDNASKVAAIIQTIRPDVLLLNEVDYDGGKSVKAFKDHFLAKSQHGLKPINYLHYYVGEVNTGVNANIDINGDGKVKQPEDAFGFGWFPGQYGMAVLSMYPIELDRVRTFQKFLWKDMPDALLPVDPQTQKSWYSKEALALFRLSSKSHWDLPIRVRETEFHFLVCHPTPPVFDGEEDRNGKRNHDEIRLWADYIRGDCQWLYDDSGNRGGIVKGAAFVIAGDLNADPNDGDSTNNAIDQLLKHELVQSTPVPQSTGGAWYAAKDGKANLKQNGNPSCDTGNFNDESVGNVRVDYVLPSTGMKIRDQGVFWPKPGELGSELADGSDHRMVWIDIEIRQD